MQLLNQKPQSQKPQSQAQKPLNQSPNLLGSIKESPSVQVIKNHHIAISTGVKIAVILLQTIFIILLGLNTKTISDISKLETEVKELEGSLISVEQNILEVKNIIRKIDILKTAKAGRVEYSDKLGKIYALNPSQITLKNIRLKGSVAQITLESGDALGISSTMSMYISQGLAGQINLESAALDKNSNIFTAQLEVFLK